ncbi:hypothetical protein [Flavilitoribacter nigricans]|nr:hypothetical protein [Flavilitoribacter nigricans]
MRTARSIVLSVLLLLTIFSLPVHSQNSSTRQLYWSDVTENAIAKAGLDGSGQDPFLSSPVGDNAGIAVDSLNHQIFFASGASIKRARLDGNHIREVVRLSAGQPLNIALDIRGRKIYWTDSQNRKIQRANMDGSQVEDLITHDLSNRVDIELDLESGKMYWMDSGNRVLRRANLDGTQIETILDKQPESILFRPRDLVLDPRNKKIYWADWGLNKIQSVNFDGTQIEDVFSRQQDGSLRPIGLAFDAKEQTLYIAESFRIKQIDIASRNILAVIGNVSEANHVALDPTNRKLYWTSSGLDLVERATLDLSDREILIQSSTVHPIAVAVDERNQHIYWSEIQGKNRGIYRAHLDGSQQESLVSVRLGRVIGIAVDTLHDKIYWTNAGEGKIQRANLDGRDVEDVLQLDSFQPAGIAIDIRNNKIYWSANHSGSRSGCIFRADLDGNDMDTLVSMKNGLFGVALNGSLGRLYFTRLNGLYFVGLDGGNLKGPITPPGGGILRHLVVDEIGQRVYWTNQSNKIQSANLDGTQITDFVTTGLAKPSGIALGRENIQSKEEILVSDHTGRGYIQWTKNKSYILDGPVFIEAGDTLAIEAGTVIRGRSKYSALIVARGGYLKALGTPAHPIIFTTYQDDLDHQEDLPTFAGRWSGIAILGQARLNSLPEQSHLSSFPEDEVRARYGAQDLDEDGLFETYDDQDGSGVMRYVSIRFAGAELTDTPRQSALLLAGVGSNTEIDHIEVLYSDGDGVRILGGTVNTAYLVSAFCQNFAFVTNEGYCGSNQFWLSVQNHSVGASQHLGGTQPIDGYPFTAPAIYNATFIRLWRRNNAPALTFRDNGGGSYRNSIFLNYGTGIELELKLDGRESSYRRFLDHQLAFTNNIFWNAADLDANELFRLQVYHSTQPDDDFAATTAENLFAKHLELGGNAIENPQLINIKRSRRSLNFRPKSTAVFDLLAPLPPEDLFIQPAGFKGAFEPNAEELWIAGWTGLIKLALNIKGGIGID